MNYYRNGGILPYVLRNLARRLLFGSDRRPREAEASSSVADTIGAVQGHRARFRNTYAGCRRCGSSSSPLACRCGSSP